MSLLNRFFSKNAEDRILALETRVDANTKDSNATLNNYTTSANAYTFPADGYLYVNTGKLTTGTVNLHILSSDGLEITPLYFTITQKYEIRPMFVKKGMKCYVTIPSGANVYYYSLK